MSRFEPSLLGLVNSEDALFASAIHASLVNNDIITSPLDGETGVSATPTITTAKRDSLEWLHVTHSGDQTVSSNTNVIFNQKNGGNIPYDTSTGIVSLKGGKTYRLTHGIALWSYSSSINDGWATFKWCDAQTNNDLVANALSIHTQVNRDVDESGNSVSIVTFTPSADIDVRVRCSGSGGTVTVRGGFSWIDIQQIDPRYLSYVHSGTQIQIRHKANKAIIYDSGEVADLSHAVSSALASTTLYEVRARHKHSEGYWLRWSDWRTFTTA